MTQKEFEQIAKRVFDAASSPHIDMDSGQVLIGSSIFLYLKGEETICNMPRQAWVYWHDARERVIQEDAPRLLRELEMRIKA